jgi:outer membrane protein assembly factor BamB
MRSRLSAAGRVSARRRSLLALAVVASLAGCITVAVRAATAPGCTEWAQEFSLTGTLNWQVRLESGPGSDLGPDAAPLAVGGVAVFAQSGEVHGLRLDGGRPLWTYTDGLSVYGMWRWQGLVVVLSGQTGGGPAVRGAASGGRLTGLDAATGVVRWTLPLSDVGPQPYAVATADGGLAVVGMLGQLLVVDMADGTVRWSREVGQDSAGLAAAAGLVLYGSGGSLTAYGDRAGVRRWTVASTDMDLPQMQLAAGLLVVSSAFGGAPVTAYTPADGRVAWTSQTRTLETVTVAAGTAGVAVAAANLPGPGRLSLLLPATGRVIWQIATRVGAGPLLTPAGVVDIEGTAANGPMAIVDRDASDGRIRWQDTLQQTASAVAQGDDQLVQAGRLALVQSNAAAGQPVTLSAYWLDDGRPAWQATLPADTDVPPVVVPGQGVLVQPDEPFSGCGPVPV